MRYLVVLFLFTVVSVSQNVVASTSCASFYGGEKAAAKMHYRKLGFSESVANRIANEESKIVQDSLIELNPTRHRVELFYRGLNVSPDLVKFSNTGYTIWAGLDEYYAFAFALNPDYGNEIFRGSRSSAIEGSTLAQMNARQQSGSRFYATVMELEAVDPLISVKSWESGGELYMPNAKTYVRRIGVLTFEKAKEILEKAQERTNFIPSVKSFQWYTWDEAVAAGLVNPN